MAKFSLTSVSTALAVGIVAVSAAIPASAEHESIATDKERQCLYVRSINGFNSIDDEHVIFTVGANKKYLVSTFNKCHNLDWSEQIAIKSSGSWTCSYSADKLIYSDGISHRTCLISNIQFVESSEQAHKIAAAKKQHKAEERAKRKASKNAETDI